MWARSARAKRSQTQAAKQILITDATLYSAGIREGTVEELRIEGGEPRIADSAARDTGRSS
jgi:hypothetical protein